MAAVEPASSRAGTWAVRWVDSARDIPQDLWAACFGPPVEGRWWYLALQDSGLEDQFAFAYAVLEKNGVAAGIAPAFVFDVPVDLIAPPPVARFLRGAGRLLARLRYQRTLFVGSPCADEGTVGLVDPADFPAAAVAVQDAAETRARGVRASMIVWKDFPDAAAPALRPLVDAGRLFVAASYPGTRVPVPGRDFAAYLKALSGSHRHNLKKKLKRSREQGPLDASVVRRPDADTLEEVFGLFWQTYEKGKTKFEVLNRAFFRHIQDYDGSHFVLLRSPVTGRLVAFMLCFHVGDRVINKFIGLDYAHYDGNWFLYFRLWEAAVEWAAGLGATEFQSGQTGYRAKLDVGCTLVPLTNYCRHRNPVLNAVFSRVARGIDWSGLDDDLKTWVAAHPQKAADLAAGGMTDLGAAGNTLFFVSLCVAIETCEQSLYRLAGRTPRRFGPRWWASVGPAVVLHVGGLAAWYWLLRVASLAVALPLIGLQYVTIALAARLLFAERVDGRRWLGIAVIVAGFALIAAYSGEAAP